MSTGRALILSYIALVIVGLVLIPIALWPWRVAVALVLLVYGCIVVSILIYVHLSEHANEQDLRQQRYKFHEEQPLTMQGTQPKADSTQYYMPYQQSQRPYQYQDTYE